jgi:thiosulfate dehydrogenase [quinone] large subunit
MVDVARNHQSATSATTSRAAVLAQLAPSVDGQRSVSHSGTGRQRPRQTGVAALGLPVRCVLAGIRIALGWVFLWAFLDKMFGLGHDTVAAKSWLNGGSPTKGFLGSAAKGPFVGFYHALAGTGFADVMFMVGLLTIGVALILGVGMRFAAAAGAVLTVMMWTVVLPPDSNPFMDDHLIYAAVLVVLALLGAGNTLGLGRAWSRTALVRRSSWLS